MLCEFKFHNPSVDIFGVKYARELTREIFIKQINHARKIMRCSALCRNEYCGEALITLTRHYGKVSDRLDKRELRMENPIMVH